MAYTTLGVIILWFGWFGFNPGLDARASTTAASASSRYVALNTNLAAAAGVLGAVITSWLVIKKPDLSMMLNGAIAALVAITAACAFVAPVGRDRDRLRRGRHRRRRRARRGEGRHRRPVGAVAAHGMSGVWGTLSLGFLAVPSLADKLDTGTRRALLRRRLPPARRPGARARRGRRIHVQASFAVLWVFKRTVGIRTEPEVETAGLDVSEHGMWGYPEFYIPVPGGYGTESHGHLGLAHAHRHPAPAHAMTPAVEPSG